MSYGLQVTNNSNVVTVSNVYKPLIFHRRGTVNVASAFSDRPGYGTVTFPAAITTPEPPSLFLRHVSGVHSSMSIYYRWLGSSGNWTGFTVISGVSGGALQNHILEWVACKYTNTSVNSGYGMQLYNASGQPIYNTTERMVRFSRFTKAWSMSELSPGFITYTPIGISIQGDDFVCVSSFDRGVVWHCADRNTQYCGLSILDDGARTLRIRCQMNFPQGRIYPNPQTDGLYFCMPICKFPASVYAN